MLIKQSKYEMTYFTVQKYKMNNYAFGNLYCLGHMISYTHYFYILIIICIDTKYLYVTSGFEACILSI